MTNWSLRGTVVAVRDGDTATMDLDLGLGIWARRVGVRFYGCNARELSMPGGPEARDHVAQLLPVGSVVAVESIRWDKYAWRVDALVRLPCGADLTAVLVADGWAAAWNGTGPAPVPPWPRVAPA